MFRSYLVAALRNLARNKLYAAINIIGLAVGFAAAILIALFVRDEFSYDRWIPNADQTYILGNVVTLPGRALQYSDASPAELAAMMKLDFPQIEAIARITASHVSLRKNENETVEQVYWADPNFFDLIRLPAIAGDLRTALDRPDSIVMTQRMARKYFGKDDAVGETIELDRKNVMTVTAVLRDLPSNTHLDTEIFGSGRVAFSFLAQLDAQPPDDRNFEVWAFTYLRLKPGVAIGEVARGLDGFIHRHKEGALRNGFNVRLNLLPIPAIHLAEGNFAVLKPRGHADVSYSMAAVGVLIVLIASINFVNLMTARAVRRAVEVGIRKVSGARRRDLIVQFIGESLIYMLFGMVFAIALLELALPWFNGFLDRTIVFDYWRDPALVGGMVAVTLAVSLLAGAYPAFVLSSFSPAAALKGGAVQPGGSGLLRQGLVVMQFAVLIGLILSTGVIYRQTEYALHEGLRIDQDQVVLIWDRCKNAFKDEVAKLPGVRRVACSSGLALNFSETVGTATTPDGVAVVMGMHPVDFGFFEFFGLRPLAGRFFLRNHGGDAQITDYDKEPFTAPVVINENAARKLNFASAEAAVGKTISIGHSKDRGVSEIIGVAPDFAVDAVHEPIAPVFYYLDQRQSELLTVKLTGRDIPETLQAIDRLWKTLGPPRPIQRFFLDGYIQSLYTDISRQALLFTAFAGVALFIAGLGLFGLSAFTAERRTKEIGIRKAMGAKRFDIVKLLVWQFAKPILWANLIAWPVGYYFMNRWLQGFAYHVDLELWVFLAAAGLALIIALLTVSTHAFLVARARPVTALRYE